MSGSEERTEGVEVSRCSHCRAIQFPKRFLCPNCGSGEMGTDRIYEAVVEETTVVRHAQGRPDWQPRHLAAVLAEGVLPMVVGLEGPIQRGARVGLAQQGFAVYATPQDAEQPEKARFA